MGCTQTNAFIFIILLKSEQSQGLLQHSIKEHLLRNIFGGNVKLLKRNLQKLSTISTDQIRRNNYDRGTMDSFEALLQRLWPVQFNGTRHSDKCFYNMLDEHRASDIYSTVVCQCGLDVWKQEWQGPTFNELRVRELRNR